MPLTSSQGCETTYVQWVQTHSSTDPNSGVAYIVSDSLQPSTSTKHFECQPGAQGRFSDPNICNVFHVCIQRNSQTVDQPFMCPYPTIFKTISSDKMYCARPEPYDCKGKAFYRGIEPNDVMGKPLVDDSISYRLPENTLIIENCTKNGLYADNFYCNGYHKCINGQDQQYLCENQLLFNPISNVCDYPINVDCGGKSLLRRPLGFSNGTLVNSSYIMVFGSELRPECPDRTQNVLVSDVNYCNVFYHCQGGQGSVYMCKDGHAFDIHNEQSQGQGIGSCRLEETVDCENRLILTSNGKHEPKQTIISKNQLNLMSLMNNDGSSGSNNQLSKSSKTLRSKYSNFILLPPTLNQKVVVNVQFDCKGRIDGHWRDTRYCDVFHACIAGEQRRSYGCNQVAERFFFDDVTQRCEFTSQNPNGCQANQYYTAIEEPPSLPGSSLSTAAPTEPWKIFIQSREQFTCAGKQDGFYASRWCNTFYRCYTGIASAFLCPKMPSGARLWWVQHGSPQGVPQETASCTWPCETGRRCTSSGGIIIDNGNSISEGQQEADSVFQSSLCTTPGSSSGITGVGATQPPFNSGSGSVGMGAGTGGHILGTGSSATNSGSGNGYQTGVGGTGSIPGSGNFGTGPQSSGSTGPGAGGFKLEILLNVTHLFLVTFTVDSNISCIGQADGAFLSSRYCNIFHRCVSGTRRDFRCPRATNTPYDLWWNQQTQLCDWPCRIQCQGQIYGTQGASAQQIRQDDSILNRNECNGYQVQAATPSVSASAASSSNLNQILGGQAMVYSAPVQTSRLIENPDLNFVCNQPGKYASRRFCNVYHECVDSGVPPSQSYECLNSFFDRSQGICTTKDQVPCMGGIFPYDSIPVDKNPDAITCSTQSGFYIHSSRQFCNIYYICDGIIAAPTTFRCYDRQTGQEGIFDPFAERCDSRKNSNCQNSILNFGEQQQYKSIPVDYQRIENIQPLSCKSDQQYLIEHEQYCNLYHSCKQGDYRIYACISTSSDPSQDQTSYFYQSNGQCAGPVPAICPKTKSVYAYSRLLPTTESQPLLMLNDQQHNYGSIPIQERVKPQPVCKLNDNYIIGHELYCNLFYGCKDGELILYACIDRLTGTYGGIFQSSTGNCIIPSQQECPTNEYFQPIVSAESQLSPNENNIVTTLTTHRPSSVAFMSYTMLEQNNLTSRLNSSIFYGVQSLFSCKNRQDGYYESEWCNVFYRCFNGKRMDERCPPGQPNLQQGQPQYDLWWTHQNQEYNHTHPHYFGGKDYMSRCEWPCKIQCKKPIWVSKDQQHPVDADIVKRQDQQLRPDCSTYNSRKMSEGMIMYSDIPNPTNFSTCPLSDYRQRVADSKYCNVFHECTNGKVTGSFLCIESQFDQNEKDCVSFTNYCQAEKRYSYSRNRLAAQQGAYYEAIEVRSVNPSGYECITDGIHTDPMFCNLFHACSGRTRRTFQCRQTGTDGINDGVSTFDLSTKSCAKFSTQSCQTILYNQEFVIIPVMFKPPSVSPCGKEGFFPVVDNMLASQYCNMFAWCPKGHGEAKVFECVPSLPGAHAGAFDLSRRSCSSKATCPKARLSSPHNTSLLALTLRPKVVTIGSRKQFSLTSTMVENGYIALGTDFQTTFSCPPGYMGFYSNPNYCDVFHYCYETGELSSFVCASMPNRYQLWWSHQNENPRSDNIFCDWPCNLQGVYACPSYKQILMRDRQPVGSVSQREVVEATCSSAQVPVTQETPIYTIYPPFNGNAQQAQGQNGQIVGQDGLTTFYQPSPPGMSSGQLGYQPCSPSNEWYVSQTTIRCSSAFAATGYAPDPKDCSKYYQCDQSVGQDGMSTGVLMQCIAGLWWDQQRRSCVLPSEVACNPFNIINSQGQATDVGGYPPQPQQQPSVYPTVGITTPFVYQPQTPVQVQGAQSAPCRGAPLCIDVGLNILQQMKAIPGRPGWFYKCDSQCALEMRCPPGLIFDDLYQRCEWPSSQQQQNVLGSLRDKKDINEKIPHVQSVDKLLHSKLHSTSTIKSKQRNDKATKRLIHSENNLSTIPPSPTTTITTIATSSKTAKSKSKIMEP
ncbi:unnamed protein product [Didymodactylos carnosus]|uniref:Chitin-binding type-2 domain-containing protein n=1 Tax=Didymodactylos carnosus TaxID=1234261 RepID=A0A814C0I2_9BILA|nr:unnamed protein product [Didymodactylos carnosus]CAF3711172.1 unnamed protein product [Didymodactylos carnosus]